ncbi:MAG: hypothetical protein ACI8TX_003684 [Hyphomicrobiaceae bacterium]|jgi:hypothetical protein
MERDEKQALSALPLILAIGAALGWAGSQGSLRIDGWPVFAICGFLCFLLNWVVFVHAYAAQTERFFDLTGSLTYLSATAIAGVLQGLWPWSCHPIYRSSCERTPELMLRPPRAS